MIGLGYSQRKVETDTLKARAAFKIRLSGTWYDRSSFFGFLNGSNQLGLSGIADNAVNSAKIIDASIANADIVDPWVGITAGAGLWSSSTTLNLGQLITMKVLTDDSTITITNDTLHVISVAGGSVELNPNNVIVDSSGLKVNYDPVYLAVSGANAITSNWYSKNGGVSRSNWGYNQIITNDTIYYPMPQCEASGHLDAWGASGGETLYIFNKAGDSQDFTLTTDSTRYAITPIIFSENDSFYVYTAGTAYIDNIYLISPRFLTLADSGITGDKIGAGEVEYLHLSNALHDSLSAWKVQLSDTNALKSYDGNAYQVLLTQLSATNIKGLGVFVKKDSATIRSSYGAAYVGKWVSYQSNTAGQRWFSMDVLEKKPLKPEMFGAIGDASTDDFIPLQNSLIAARNLKLVWQLSSIYATSDTLEIGFGYGEGMVISGTGSGHLNGGKSGLKPTGTAGGIRLYTTGVVGKNIVIENITIVRDTSSTKRSAIGIEIDSLTNVSIVNCNIEGFNIGLSGNQCGQLYLSNTSLRHNIRGFWKENHADGIRIENGFVAQNDSFGVDLTGISAAFSISSTELSHQPIHVKVGTNSSVSMFSNRMENADSCAFLLESGSKLITYEPSFMANASNKIIARMTGSDNTLIFISPDIGSDFNVDSTVITVSISQNYVYLWNPLKASLTNYIKVYDQTNNTIYQPSMFVNAMNTSLPIASEKSEGRVFQLHKKTTTGVPSGLAMVRKMDETGTFFTTPFFDNADLRVSINGDSSNFSRSDYLRNVGTQQSVTLESSGNFTHDTLFVDQYFTSGDYVINITPRFSSDSLISAKVFKRTNTTGEIIASIYHKGVNSLSGTLYYYFIYKARANDY